jgi:hypothetical protein
MFEKNSPGGARKPGRKHGYRGYGSELSRGASFGGAIHWGRGFTGVEIPGTGGSALAEPVLFPSDAKDKRSKS